MDENEFDLEESKKKEDCEMDSGEMEQII